MHDSHGGARASFMKWHSGGPDTRCDDALHEHLLEERELWHDGGVSDPLILVQHREHAAAVQAGRVEDGTRHRRLQQLRHRVGGPAKHHTALRVGRAAVMGVPVDSSPMHEVFSKI